MKPTKELILLTGASSGIGREMAWELARTTGADLILVARRAAELAQLKADIEGKYPSVKVWAFPADLSNLASVYILVQELKIQGLVPTGLINNAGMGVYGDFSTTSLEEEITLINLNISALVVLTKLIGTEMKQRGRGRILNVGSILSYFPFPNYAVYAASKAFVLSFTEAIRSEWEGSGLQISVFSPGPTDTPFTTPGMASTNAYASLQMASPKAVAQEAIRVYGQTSRSYVSGLLNRFLTLTPGLTPRWLTLKINKHMSSRKG